MNTLHELIVLIGSFVGTAFTLVRYSLNQNRGLTDRFVTFLESSLRRHEQINSEFQVTLDELTENVRENSHLLARLAERLQHGGVA